MTTLVQNAFGQAGESEADIEELKTVMKTGEDAGVWVLPADHHVTTMFIGGNKKKM